MKLRDNNARKGARYAASEKGKATIARYRPAKAAHNARRVRPFGIYLGMAPTPEHAADLNQMGRDFAAQQKGAA